MRIDLVAAITGSLGLMALAYGIRLLARPAKTEKTMITAEPAGPKKSGERESKTLADVSRIWVGRKEVLDFREIARIWRITQETIQTPSAPEYQHDEIAAFHAKWVQRPVVRGEKKAVIEGILSILDQHGDCPSVVQRNENESEKKYDRNVFDKLATVPLWRHSLDVAGNLAGRMKQAIMLPDAVIAGLGHDLGKIPSYQEALYRTGDHPIVSIIALNRIPGYESLKNRDDISLAVRQHHLVKAETPLGADLKEADRETRLAEISRLTDGPLPETRQNAQPLTEPHTSEAVDSKQEQAETAKMSKPAGNAPQEQIPPAPIGREEAHPAATVSGNALGGLDNLDLDKLLSVLRLRINKLEKGRWSIISTLDGLVLVQPDELWAQLKKQIGATPAIQMAEGDEGRKREILGRIVSRLDREKQAIAGDLLKHGFHTTQCLVVMENGKAMKVPLIPFRVETFGLLPSALEKLKSPDLNRMAKKVKTVRESGHG
ncbi:MAG: HD domain-containing protein [Desulfomicrobium apsheronum]|nr:HD domain-containing protein [Desulfomicrobium apsheronum]